MTVHKKPGSAAHREPRFRSVLFICAANTARSVMAEHLLRRELAALGAAHRVRVTSAGIAPFARDGALVSLDTRLALRATGIHLGEEATSTDLKRHPEMIEEAELIIAMTEEQARQLAERFPAAAGRQVFTLRSIAGEPGDIADPYDQGEQVFSQCREEIERLVPAIVARLFHEE